LGSPLYIHIDLDVLDPKEYPHVPCPTQGGISINRLKEILHQIKKSPNVVGISLVEYSSENDKGTGIAETLDVFLNSGGT
jgi:arginase